MRIAMWSGPRNISTAMMYAFASRPDFDATDEPFYACYLQQTGLEHPMRAEVLAAQPTEPREVIAQLARGGAGAKPHAYEKHMTQHMIAAIPRDWLGEVHSAFLIRHPARVVASFAAKYERPRLQDLGFEQQPALFAEVRALGQEPPVLDSTDVRADPERALRALCEVLELPWDARMLSWPSGGHPADGVWAPHWYGAVRASTGFAGAEGPLPELSGELASLAERAMPYYQELYQWRLRG